MEKAGRRFFAAAADERGAVRIRAALPGAEVFVGKSEAVLAAADAALVKCGTAALQAALAGTPMAVVYRVSGAARFAAGFREFRLPFFSLPNILSGRFIVPEFIQGEANAEAAAGYMGRLLEDEKLRAAQVSAMAPLRGKLSAPGGGAAAEAALSLL